ncbi:AMP-binding protein [Thiorhodovibrio frisius]|uniref:AMP-binding protein n=1 Tax=Thiorhodovibrio frisius TaxID=631362 RepID=UPI000255DD12|nr:AMP-binding protein [Thiorhodovibrio frisius]
MSTAGWHIGVADAQKQLLCEGEEGHLQDYSRQHLFSGYVGGEPEDKTAALSADGWFRTGDLGVMNNGEITITGHTVMDSISGTLAQAD